MSEKQTRGKLTDRIKVKSKELLGYEVDVCELRLIPYIQHVMINEQHLDISKVSPSERIILAKWREAKYIIGGASSLNITREFWDIMNELIFLGYVDLD